MKPGTFLKYLVIAIVAANLALAAVIFVPGCSSKQTPMPVPNGYDDFIKATQLESNPLPDYSTFGHEALSNLVAQNEPAWKALQEGLKLESRVPDNYSPSNAGSILSALGPLKQCIRLFCAEGELAEMEGRTNDAANIYLNGVRFGQESCRGGVFIHRLVGIACESICLGKLQPLAQSLSAPECAAISRSLEEIDSKEETVPDTLAQENTYMDKTGNLQQQIARLILYKQIRETKQKVMAKINANTAYRRRVMADFAVRAYELDKGHRPASLADLVPTYLKSVPQNPTNNTSIAYHP